MKGPCPRCVLGSGARALSRDAQAPRPRINASLRGCASTRMPPNYGKSPTRISNCGAWVRPSACLTSTWAALCSSPGSASTRESKVTAPARCAGSAAIATARAPRLPRNRCALWTIAQLRASTVPRGRMNACGTRPSTICTNYADSLSKRRAPRRAREGGARAGVGRFRRSRACSSLTLTPPSGGSRCGQSIGSYCASYSGTTARSRRALTARALSGQASRAPPTRAEPSQPSRAVASVHNWERIGALICAILRRVLYAALLRYVDDMFGAERQAEARIEPPAGAPVAAGWPSRGRSNTC